MVLVGVICESPEDPEGPEMLSGRLLAFDVPDSCGVEVGLGFGGEGASTTEVVRVVGREMWVGPMGCPAGLLFVSDGATPALIVFDVGAPGFGHEEFMSTAQFSVGGFMSPLELLSEGLPVDICM